MLIGSDGRKSASAKLLIPIIPEDAVPVYPEGICLKKAGPDNLAADLQAPDTWHRMMPTTILQFDWSDSQKHQIQQAHQSVAGVAYLIENNPFFKAPSGYQHNVEVPIKHA